MNGLELLLPFYVPEETALSEHWIFLAVPNQLNPNVGIEYLSYDLSNQPTTGMVSVSSLGNTARQSSDTMIMSFVEFNNRYYMLEQIVRNPSSNTYSQHLLEVQNISPYSMVRRIQLFTNSPFRRYNGCLLYTSDAADE